MFDRALEEHMSCFSRLKDLKESILEVGRYLGDALKNGQKILICGNGGSAADAQHFAAEIVGRFTMERKAWPAVALTTDTSILSAIANDYGYESVFERQVEALGKTGDILIGLSTSGNSPNVIRAVDKAKDIGLYTVVLLGGNGGVLKQSADNPITIPVAGTARVQEAHIFILHLWAEIIEHVMTKGLPQHEGLS
jgi:D-sedoheptulose 7-phosphate isomerase